MTKPNEYRKTYMLATDAPYSNSSSSAKGTHSGEGTLQRGRVVWLQANPSPTEEDVQVSAYAEGVGLVLLGSRSIQPVR